MTELKDYRSIIGDKNIYTIHKKMKQLYGERLLHINSTHLGGGVASILSSLVPLMNDIGVDAGWRTLHGYTDFYGVTKKFHNALQGEKIHLTEMKKRLYVQTSEQFSSYTHIDLHHFVIVHDPQPLPLIQFYKKRSPWIWRCHIDLSAPNPKLWDYLKEFIIKYDIVIFSNEKYKSDDLPMDYKIIPPGIDPLSLKNQTITDSVIARTLKNYQVPTDKPIISQISRFDKWKDPLGVIEIYKKVIEKISCRLVLCGNMAIDDPEGFKIFETIQKKAKRFIERGDIILLTAENTILVNSLQRISKVIIQKSIKEGFGLTVTEALWKEKPVVASNVGGIPLQIHDGYNGFLLAPDDIVGFSERIIELLQNATLAHEIGKNGHKTTREKFIITRILSDYLDLFNAM